MVMRDVPLHASRYPRAYHSDQGRAYHVLAVEEVVSRLLVGSRENPSADFRKNADFRIFVLQSQILVVPVDAVVGKDVVDGIGIYMPRSSLIGPSREEIGVRLRVSDEICRDRSGRLLHFHLPVRRVRGAQQGGKRQDEIDVFTHVGYCLLCISVTSIIKV